MTPKEVADYLIQNRQKTRTRRNSPCPVCKDGGGHCLRMDDDSAALCPKTDGTGSVKSYKSYGHLYILTGSLPEMIAPPPAPKTRRRTDEELDAHWRPRVREWYDRGRSEVGRLAAKLRVITPALQLMGTGWDGKSWTLPEKNGIGQIVGVSRRFEDGAKRCYRGSKRGLTYSKEWKDLEGPVLIVEGASDVAAGITLGLSTIGRPSNVGGGGMLAVILRGCTRKVIVIGERDRKDDGRWPGMEGCQSSASGLSQALHRMVSAQLLPDGAKDLRGWLNSQPIDIAVPSEVREARERLLRAIR